MELILKYFNYLTELQKDQFANLEALYSDWNSKINVISRKDIDQLYLRHILHSLAIARYIQFNPGAKIMDVGTGGGFPGIPLAIMFPESEFLLVDSVGKKIKVVRAVSDELKLLNCRAIQSRGEEVKEKFDFITSRAVASLPVFIGWVKNSFLKENRHSIANGILYLKGGDLTDELDIPFRSKIVEISRYFVEPFFESKKIVYVEIAKK